MTQLTSRFGETRDIDIDFDRLEQYQEEHPDWNLIDALGALQTFKIKDLDPLAWILGFENANDWFKVHGYSLRQMDEAYAKSSLLGFSDPTDGQASH